MLSFGNALQLCGILEGAVVRVMADHDGIAPGCPNEDTMVTDMVLDVADDDTLRDPAER